MNRAFSYLANYDYSFLWMQTICFEFTKLASLNSICKTSLIEYLQKIKS